MKTVSSYTAIHIPELPNVPEKLLDYTHDFEDFAFRPVNYKDTVVKNGEVVPGRLYCRQAVSPELEQWIKNNIVNTYANIGISKNIGPCLGPHLDKTRFYTLHYTIEPGGSNVQTVFYEPSTDEAILDTDKLYVTNYSKLDTVDSIIFQPRQWYAINGRQLHSVENIETMRISLQVGLMRDPLIQFKERNIL
jgi:hypothetical protein|tara:strand:+ start:1052 stop:1627 length:576 start_codon:yes stop_codon:yes gene_type:complete